MIIQITDQYLSKIIENSCTKGYLIIDIKNLIDFLQFGFRPKFSATYALINLTIINLNRIRQTLDECNFSIFVDLQKAFNTVDHKMLLHELEYYRFHLAVLLWRADYMRECNILGESHLAVNKLGARSCVNSQKRKYFLFSWQRLLFKKFGKTNFFLL